MGVRASRGNRHEGRGDRQFLLFLPIDAELVARLRMTHSLEVLRAGGDDRRAEKFRSAGCRHVCSPIIDRVCVSGLLNGAPPVNAESRNSLLFWLNRFGNECASNKHFAAVHR